MPKPEMFSNGILTIKSNLCHLTKLLENFIFYKFLLKKSIKKRQGIKPCSIFAPQTY